ncbi:phosphoribosylaminoimidazole carboxamide formyl transferase/IMP cyclo-hydrolase [Thermoplasma volcanium GSS1]|uniref:Phosphoribosylaminoimidazole carboxamide formyl transferase/IMP cyclo-hydrolase n=1 Tax=Thermoplasma volcanium (strain ATCC 51530 / DSM 4299 / JCM 9571 / NBRC 15438 / GSS1) TaxID=273116 RepID=Q97CT5_THEVO|nr:bifunctional phosphoribosylaminoimidazolecarboxamide formyltransferase/IMP cyclohydrolase [Thermoplasma volcanium]BAB59158.1 phosphoribosylaminoimidazole carboxamide formyl transferase/IMP cyclo-hydrolase [Thermoplasma volcanium GSS1]
MNFLISVYNKEGLTDFLARVKANIDYIYATGGTAKFLEKNGYTVRDTSEITGFSDLLGGRVKTLHPKIYAALLYREKNEASDLHFDVLVSNLYPFTGNTGNENEMIENIDIGGVSLTRAAAKNYKNVLVLSSPDDYTEAAEIISSGKNDAEYRKRMALKAFARMAEYDAIIYNGLSDLFKIEKENFFVVGKKGERLRYGENPDQEGFLYSDGSAYGVANAEKLNGKELSYNNILDADSAFDTALEFDEPTVVVMKHNTPSGVSSHNDIVNAFKRAWDADSESAYGSVIAVNRKVPLDLAKEMRHLFIEVLIAPEYDEYALSELRKKKNLRILRIPWIRDQSMRYRSISNGLLVQTPMASSFKELKLVTEKGADSKTIDDLLFAWKVVAHSRSNAIVFAKDKTTTGIGAGQTSRVESVRIAMERSGSRADGSVMASDAFFPFPDSIDVAAKAGIKAIIQPGGSIRDEEVIKKCNEYGIPMYFTGKRVFLH